MAEIEFASDMMVTLKTHMGDDLLIVNAARGSLGVEHEQFEASDYGLIKSLIRDEHGAPFEVVNFVFVVEVPLFIARQWFKHRFSGFSEKSGRYSKILPKFYIPADEDVMTQVGKSMSYTYKTLEPPENRQWFIDRSIEHAKNSYALYEESLVKGVAKQEARMNIPQNFYTRFYWKTDLRNLTNFLVLRNDHHAQLEIQRAAKIVEQAFASVAPVTYEIWCNEGRKRLAGID